MSKTERRAAILSSKRAWLLVAFMWLAYVLDYSDRQAIFSIFPLLKSQLNFSNVELGLSGSLFLWVYGLCSPIAGQIGDRISKRVLVAVSLALWSGVTFITGLANSAFVVLVCRALTGVTEALFMPAAIALTAYAHTSRTRSLAIGVLTSAQMGGLIVGGWYGGFAAQEFSWRAAFYVLGVLGIIYAIPYWIFLKGTHEEFPSNLPGISNKINKLAIVKLAKVPMYRWLCVCFPVYTALLWMLYTWLPDFLYEKFSLSLAEAGFTATVYLQSATFLGLLAGGVLADWLYLRTRASRFWILCGGILFSSPWVILLAYSHSLLYFKLAACGFGFGNGLFMANFFVSAFEVVPPDTRASAVGVINFIGAPISGLAVLLTGIWKKGMGIENLMSYCACIAILFGLLLIIEVNTHFQADFEKAQGFA